MIRQDSVNLWPWYPYGGFRTAISRFGISKFGLLLNIFVLCVEHLACYVEHSKPVQLVRL